MSPIDFSTWIILAVDDEPDNLSLLDDVLAFSGAQVVTARSGEQAIELLNRQPFSLALVDIQMPRVSGWDVIQHIRSSQNPDLRNMLVIAVTAVAMIGDRERVLAAGFNGYISKPIEVEMFMERIEAIVQPILAASQRKPVTPPAEAQSNNGYLDGSSRPKQDTHENSTVQP